MGKKNKFKAMLSSVGESKYATIGLIAVVIIIVIALLAPILAPYDYTIMDKESLLQKPSAEHWLGTDQFGRDVLSRILIGTRVSLLIGGVVVLLSLAIGIPMGMAAGYYGRTLDSVIMRITDIMLAFPWVLVALLAAAIFNPGVHVVIISLTFAYVPSFARLTRSVVASIREQSYVEAAIMIGEKDISIMLRYILPNCIAPIIVQASTVLASVILGEAGISYLGLGIQPPTPSWGGMLSESATYLWNAPHLSIFPAIAIIITVLAVNFFGDGLRDILDPTYVKEV